MDELLSSSNDMSGVALVQDETYDTCIRDLSRLRDDIAMPIRGCKRHPDPRDGVQDSREPHDIHNKKIKQTENREQTLGGAGGCISRTMNDARKVDGGGSGMDNAEYLLRSDYISAHDGNGKYNRSAEPKRRRVLIPQTRASGQSRGGRGECKPDCECNQLRAIASAIRAAEARLRAVTRDADAAEAEAHKQAYTAAEMARKTREMAARYSEMVACGQKKSNALTVRIHQLMAIKTDMERQTRGAQVQGA